MFSCCDLSWPILLARSLVLVAGLAQEVTVGGGHANWRADLISYPISTPRVASSEALFVSTDQVDESRNLAIAKARVLDIMVTGDV